MTRVIVLAAIGSLLTAATAIGLVPRNGLVGVRTSATMRSDRSWEMAHRAARWWLLGAAAGMAVVALETWSADRFTRNSTIALVVGIGLIAVAALVAHRAAERVEGLSSSGVGLRHVKPSKWHVRSKGRDNR